MASTTTMEPFPSQFVLHIPTRSTKKDPFAGYIRLNATLTPDGKALKLTPTPEEPYYNPPYTLKQISPPSVPAEIIVSAILLNLNNNMPLGATFLQETGRVVQAPGGAVALPILRFYYGKITNFLPSHLKRNIPLCEEKPVIVTSPAPPVLSPPLLTPVGGAGVGTTPLSLLAALASLTTPAPVPAPAPVPKKKPAAPRPPPIGDLSPHVAKQLLALARLRKEECPIIAEEFTDGNTAVMPCGHLFSRMGIEESFKKEPRKCPACRAAGHPTLV